MDVKLERKHWEESMEGHKNMILQSKMNLILAEKAYIQCEEELKKFPKKPKELAIPQKNSLVN